MFRSLTAIDMRNLVFFVKNPPVLCRFLAGRSPVLMMKLRVGTLIVENKRVKMIGQNSGEFFDFFIFLMYMI